jgi:hypothetical protein
MKLRRKTLALGGAAAVAGALAVTGITGAAALPCPAAAMDGQRPGLPHLI